MVFKQTLRYLVEDEKATLRCCLLMYVVQGFKLGVHWGTNWEV